MIQTIKRWFGISGKSCDRDTLVHRKDRSAMTQIGEGLGEGLGQFHTSLIEHRAWKAAVDRRRNEQAGRAMGGK